MVHSLALVADSFHIVINLLIETSLTIYLVERCPLPCRCILRDQTFWDTVRVSKVFVWL